jgi:cell wall-associated protease
MFKISYFYCFFLVSIIGCNAQKKLTPIKTPAVIYRNKLPISVRDCWQFLDIEKDTLAGTSLNRAYKEIIKQKKGKPIIVAVIDNYMDIHHEDLKPAIWINKKEIPNNNIDDDHNGYVDDVNGWNFLGNKDEDLLYANTESTRILKILEKKYPNFLNFNGNKIDSLLYIKTTNRYRKDKEEVDQLKVQMSNYLVKYRNGLKDLQKSFNKNKFTLSQFDSLYKININNNSLVESILFMREVYRLGKTYESLKKDSIKIENQYKTTYKEGYYDRSLLGDNEFDLKYNKYGSNNMWKNIALNHHGTIVAGIIAANRANKIGVEGFGDQIKIMPIRTTPSGGSEHDKDVSLAIRYAVDNGAKIINMSFGKTSSAYPQLIKEAILFAEINDVLIVAAAGNNSSDNDIEPFYPIDYDINTGVEYCNNFIKVAAITTDADQYFLASFTNYGKKTVDIFAPGYFLKTTYPENRYAYLDGTSMATPIVCGVAAVIRSYYPKLTASQVKQIILDSGVAYDNLKVQVPGEKEGILKPFSELSKSGKVVNVYNAMIMAGKIGKRH